MAPKSITVVDANGNERKKKLSTDEGYRNMLQTFGVSFLKDGEDTEIEDFGSLVGGSKYTLGDAEKSPPPSGKLTVDSCVILLFLYSILYFRAFK